MSAILSSGYVKNVFWIGADNIACFLLLANQGPFHIDTSCILPRNTRTEQAKG